MLFKKKDQNESIKAKTALFASKAKKDEALEKLDEAHVAKSAGEGAKESATKTLKASVAAGRVSPSILRRPRITEKATAASGLNVYTFDISMSANKRTVAGAIKDVYNVTPVKVRTVAIPAKRVTSRRGVRGKTARGRKAYVYLKKGDTIELV
ncbi:MAG TPA: 50S ribosomal protein L23 [Candidatus Paceibacterota bacterium]|nr:50S ribosomal protein L23 [Candidatus Paceibacterota bacterium]